MNWTAQAVFWALLLALAPTVLPAGTLYKCTDDNGHVTFSDVTCPESTAQRKEVQVQHSQPASNNTDNYSSLENQVKRLEAQKAQEEQQRALTRYVKQEKDRQNQMQRKAEENQEEANKLHQEAQDLYEEAGKKNLGPSRRKAIIEQAKSLERQADVLLGRRETAAPTQTERLQQRVEDAEEAAQRAERQAQEAESAARRAEMEAQFRH